MSNFNDHLDAHKLFRQIVLPVSDIQHILDPLFQGQEITSILDFGAGTFFWTDYFVNKYNCTVYAVDSYYEKINIPKKANIKTYSNLELSLNDCSSFSLIWACDVLHHLSSYDYNNFLQKIVQKTDIIIIKDIDVHHAFGNFMNRMHDKIINGETIRDVYPDKLKEYFESYGFTTTYYFIPKIWYPHFILVAIRGQPS